MALPSPEDEELIGRYYTFSNEDLRLIRRLREEENRLGFAVQLCYWRYPGRKWEVNEKVPSHILNYIAEQIDVDPHRLVFYASIRQETRRDHLMSLRRSFGYRTFTPRLRAEMTPWLLEVALTNDHGFVIMKALVEELRLRRIILPAIVSLEKLVWQVREQARTVFYERLTEGLRQEQLGQLKAVLRIQPDSAKTYLSWLREPPGDATARHLLEIINRLVFIRWIGLNPDVLQHVNRNRLLQLVHEAERWDAWYFERWENDLRLYGTLVAVLLDLSTVLTDQALDMYDRLVGTLFNRGENKHKRLFQKDGPTINRFMWQYVQIGKALILARLHQTDPYQAIENLISWEDFIRSIEEAEALLRPEDFDFLALLGNHYSSVRQYSRTFWQSFEFHGNEDTRSLRSAIRLIRQLDERQLSAVPYSAPTDFVNQRWEPYVITIKGIQRNFYELCVMSELRNRLRAGDVWVEGSRQYQNWEAYWLPLDRWQAIKDDNAIPLPVETDFYLYREQRRELLHQQFRIVNDLAAQNLLSEVRLEKGKFRFSNQVAAIPSNMKRISDYIYDQLPSIKITDLLAEVEATTHFCRAFTHLQSGEKTDDILTLLTTILGEAINLGPEKMALSSPHTSYKRLVWIHSWFLRTTTYQEALAVLVNYQLQLPLASYWGGGMSSSSDGQFYPVGGVRSAQARRNPHYGREPGVKLYTHTSDLKQAFHVDVISPSVHEAPYALNGLLYHESDLNIREHHTDTGGYTDHIFAMFYLQGYRFAPRLRPFNDQRLFTPGPTTDYPALASFIAVRNNFSLMEQQWDEILRLATSVRLGTVTASLALQRLSSYARQNRLAQALREVGRIEKTLFLLDWLQDPALRLRTQLRLSHGELQNGLNRAVFIHRLGRIRDRDYERQRYRASGLTLVTAAITLWNTVHLWHIVQRLRNDGMEITDEHLRHLSPAQWDHITLTGDYLWDAHLKTNLVNLRS